MSHIIPTINYITYTIPLINNEEDIIVKTIIKRKRRTKRSVSVAPDTTAKHDVAATPAKTVVKRKRRAKRDRPATHDTTAKHDVIAAPDDTVVKRKRRTKRDVSSSVHSNIVVAPSSSVFSIPSPHMCYMLKSEVHKRFYIGYTVDFRRRLRQHNGEIKGGAKRTQKDRPWTPVCLIKGFYEASSALRFEYRLHHPGRRIRKTETVEEFLMSILETIVTRGDGSVKNKNKMPWPSLTVCWTEQGYSVTHPRVSNVYPD